MELSRQQRQGLFLTTVAVAAAAYYSTHLLHQDGPAPIIKPQVVVAPANANRPNDEYLARQKKEWENIFDPRSPDSQKAAIMSAEKNYQESPNSTNANNAKALLLELYDQYRTTAQYERALAVLNRVLQLDGSISAEAYWQDKNELALAYLRTSQEKEAKDVIDELFGHVPSQVSAQQHLSGVLDYYLKSDRADDALALIYRIVGYDKQHEWPLFLGYRSFVRLADEFEEKAMPTKAQEVYDLGLNVEVHRNQPWGQAQIMERYAGFQERRGMKEQAEILRRDAQEIESKVNQDDRYNDNSD